MSKCKECGRVIPDDGIGSCPTCNTPLSRSIDFNDRDEAKMAFTLMKKELEAENKNHKKVQYENRKYFDKKCQEYIERIDELEAELAAYECREQETIVGAVQVNEELTSLRAEVEETKEQVGLLQQCDDTSTITISELVDELEKYRWIPFEKRSPKKGQRILVATEHESSIIIIWREDYWTGITHWMKVPEAK